MCPRLTLVLCGTVFFYLSGNVAAYGAPAKPASKIPYFPNVSYVNSGQGTATHRQTLDLYLPQPGQTKPPLLVFVHGGLWSESDDKLKFGPALANELTRRGIAVALVRYRLGPKFRHPDQVHDLAAAVAYLARSAKRHGYDHQRLYLMGHSAGAHLAALVTLDERYLAPHGLTPDSIAGVIGISGIYNLSGESPFSRAYRRTIRRIFGDDPKILEEASPITHIESGAPPFLLLSGSSDNPGHSIDTRRFAQALNRSSNQKTVPVVISGRNHFSIMHFASVDNTVDDLVLNFLKRKPLPDYLAGLLEAKRAWLGAPFSTAPFWKHEKLVRSHPVDRRFLGLLISHYGPLRHELLQWPLEKFYALDLFAYLDALPPERIGKGKYLITTNVRGEKEFWSLKEMKPYRPVIVVGLDDEKNLFDMSLFYRMQREYSWKTSREPPTMARPLGAFIYFLKEPPVTLRQQSWHFALTEDSFRLAEKNPLAPAKNLPKNVYEAMTFRNGCFSCHSFRGIGARAHHILAAAGAPHGGFALALEEYPPAVWKAFMFDQERVADKMGATPNIVADPARQLLYDLVVQERKKRSAVKK